MSLCAGSDTETVDLTGNASPDAEASPVYSLTSPASPDDDDQAGLNLLNGTLATSQQLELEEKPPAVSALADVAAQQAVQTLVTDAVQRQWEGVQSQGSVPTWQKVLLHISQELKGVSNVEPLPEPKHNKGGSQGGPLVRGDGIQGSIRTYSEAKDMTKVMGIRCN